MPVAQAHEDIPQIPVTAPKIAKIGDTAAPTGGASAPKISKGGAIARQKFKAGTSVPIQPKGGTVRRNSLDETQGTQPKVRSLDSQLPPKPSTSRLTRRKVAQVGTSGNPPVPRREKLQPPQQAANDQEHAIKKIIKGRTTSDGQVEYLVDWDGYPKTARSYEPWTNLNDAAKEWVSTHNVPVSGKPSKK